MKVAECVPGAKVGRLRVVATFTLPRNTDPTRHTVYALCRCDCGTLKSIEVQSLGKCVSCGCYIREVLLAKTTTHGLSHTASYFSLKAAKRRCTVPTDAAWPWYGAKGIEFRFASVAEGTRYALTLPYAENPGMTLDRIDNTGHYEVGNLRWVTQAENNRNRTKGWKRRWQKRPEGAK